MGPLRRGVRRGFRKEMIDMDDNRQIPDMEAENDKGQENSAGNSPQWSRPSAFDGQQGEASSQQPPHAAPPEPDVDSQSHNTFQNYDNASIQKPKVRRVGTVTLGIVLIVVGVLLIWALFDPNFSIGTIAKFSPVILILVGAEMIIGYFCSGGNKVKYDFLSMLVCFLLIFGGLVGSIVPNVVRAGLGWNQMEERIHNEVEDAIYEGTKDLQTIDSIYLDLYGTSIWNGDYTRFPTYQEIMDDQNYRVYLHVNLRGDYESGTALAQDAKEIVDRVRGLNIPLENVTFNYDGEQYSGNLELDGWYNLDLTAEEMAAKVRFEPVEIEESDTYDESNAEESAYAETY